MDTKTRAIFRQAMREIGRKGGKFLRKTRALRVYWGPNDPFVLAPLREQSRLGSRSDWEVY